MNNNFELIEDYILNRLDPDHRREFEAEVLINVELKTALDNYKLAHHISRSFIELDVRDKINELKNKKQNKAFSFYPMRIAASLFVVCLAIYFLYPSKGTVKENSDEIFTKLYVLPSSSLTRGTKDPQTRLDSAITLFDKHEYQNAKKALLEIMKEPNVDPSVYRYLGHIAIQLKDFNEASTYFKTINNATDTSIYIDANYNLMLVQIHEGNKAIARDYYDRLKTLDELSNAKLKIIESYFK